MSALERLLAEELPTGTFGGARPGEPRQCEVPRATSPLEAAAHRAALERGLDAAKGRRHLRPVPTAEAPAA